MQPSPDRPRWPAGSWLALAGVWAALACFAWANRAFELDDAFIYYRYLANALAGDGLVYNPGERFNALTSPLHTYLSLAVTALAGSVVGPMIALSAVWLAAATLALYSVFERHERHWAFVWIGPAAIVGWRYFHSLTGMETPLFLLLLAACLWLWERGRTFALGVACAGLVLTRGEGLLLVAAMGVVHLVRRRPLPAARDYAIPALLVAAHVAFGRLYYGSWLPHTLMAKVHQGRSGLWGEELSFLGVGYHLTRYFENSGALVGLVLALAALGVARLGRRDLNFAIGGFLAALAVFYATLNVPPYHWYYAPFYAFGWMYVGLGAAALWDLAGRVGGAPGAAVARAAALALALAPLALLYHGSITRPVAATVRQQVYPQIGRWLRENTPEDASVALVEVGIVGFHSQRTIVDILGVVSPKNAESLGARRYGEWLEHYDPDYILVHFPPWSQERGAVEAVQRGDYRPLGDFPFRGYALLVRDEGEDG